MGLDITLYRAIKNPVKNQESGRFYHLNDKEIERFKKVGLGDAITTKIETYLDFAAYIKVSKEEFEQSYIWCTTGCGTKEYPNDVVHTFIDTNNEYYPIYKKIEYCMLTKECPLSDEELDLIFKSGFDKDKMYSLTSGGQKTWYNLYHYIISLPRIDIIQSKCPTYEEEVTGIYLDDEELGYQRKGMKSEYYEDYETGKFDYFVLEQDQMQDLYDNYVSEVDYDGNPDTYYKESFRMILDNFVEGETVCTFSW